MSYGFDLSLRSPRRKARLALAFLFLFYSSALDAFAQQEAGLYRESQTLPLTQVEAGTSGTLRLLQKKDETKPETVIQFLDAKGQVVSEERVAEPNASVEKEFLYGTPVPTFFVTFEPLCDLGGSYCGPSTLLYEIRQGKITSLTATDGKRLSPIRLDLSLKSGWKIAPSAKTHGVDIQQVECHPNWEGNSKEFVIDYSTYRYERGGWRRYVRTRTGFWENEGEWPDPINFP